MRNKKIIAIHQPNYLPWLGYFYKIYQSDIFVFLDDVQYSNKGMHNYTYIKTSNGSYRLKYPVFQKFGDKIYEVRAKDELGWKQKHLELISFNYKKAKFFKEVFDDYSNIIMQEYDNIVDLNISFIKYFSKKLGIDREFVLSSGLDVGLNKTMKIIEICKTLGGNIYYSGTGARSYQNSEDFEKNGIELKYSVFSPVEYPQLWNDFQSNVSAIDYFMNCGYDFDRILRGQKNEND